MKVYVVIKLLKGNVPKVIGVYKNRDVAEEISNGLDGIGNVIETDLF